MNRRARRESTNAVGTGSGPTPQRSSRPLYRSSRSRRQRLAAGAVLATTGLLGTYLAALRPQPTYAAPLRGAAGQTPLQPRTAPTCHITVSDDTGLRSAILTSRDDSVICINGIIPLQADLPIIDDTTISFVGDDSIADGINGDDSFSILQADFTANASANDDDTLLVSSLTLTRGKNFEEVPNPSFPGYYYFYGRGGALYAVGSYSPGSPPTADADAVVLDEVNVLDNYAYAGALFVRAISRVSIQDSVIQNNSAVGTGALFVQWVNDAVVERVSIAGNVGDLRNQSTSGTFEVVESTVSVVDSSITGNQADQGGAAALFSSRFRMTNSFVGGNVSDRWGGAITATGDSTSLELRFTTVYDNSTPLPGAADGIDLSNGADLIAIGSVVGSSTDDTVIARRSSGGPMPIIDDTQSVSTGPQVFTDDSSVTVAKGTLGLGALDGNGPGRPGRSPAQTSVLVTQAPQSALGTGVLRDQLNALRGPTWTIGSRQVAPPSPARTPTFDAPVSTSGGFTVNVTNWDDSWTWTPLASAGSVVAGVGSGSTLPLTVTGLTAGQSSTVTVTSNRTGYAQGSANVTGQAVSASPTPPPAPLPPSAPTSVTAVPGNASATVSWSPPTNSGSFPVTSYLVTANPGGQTCLTSGTSCTVDGLTNGTTYTFSVAALNGAGWGVSGSSGPVTPSANPAPTPQPLPGPVAPGGSVLTVNGVPDPDLVVVPNASDDGLDITGDGWSMTLDGLGPDGQPLQLGPDKTLVLDAERQVRSTGSGFLPGSQVDVYMDPPVLLQTGTTGSWLRDLMLRATQATKIGSFTVAADGTFSGEATLPESILAGEHVLQAVGISPTRQTRAVSLGVIVRPWVELNKGPRTADGRHDRIRASGETGGLESGIRLAPFIRYRGQDAFTRGRASITVQTDGTFAWTRQVKKSKGLGAYVAYTDTRSNGVYWVRIR